MGKCYNIAIDSNYPYINSGNLTSQSYYINWAGVMPQGSYKMTWSFMCSSLATYTNAQLAGLALNIGGNDYFSTKQISYANTTSFCGFLPTQDIGIIHYFLTNQQTNPPIYLKSRPNENILQVNICNGVDTNSLYSTPQPTGEYLLILSFEESSNDKPE